MAVSSCLFDLVENVKLQNILEADKPGVIFAEDWGPKTSAKKFSIVNCVTADPFFAEGSAKEFRKRPRRPAHVCIKSEWAHYMTHKDRHRYEV